MSGKKITKPADSNIPEIARQDSTYILEQLQGNKHINEEIKSMVRDFILNDKDIDKEIEKVVDKIEKEKFKIFLTKIAFGAWSFIMVLLGAVLPVIIEAIRK